jgi:hypothetical protein
MKSVTYVGRICYLCWLTKVLPMLVDWTKMLTTESTEDTEARKKASSPRMIIEHIAFFTSVSSVLSVVNILIISLL